MTDKKKRGRPRKSTPVKGQSSRSWNIALKASKLFARNGYRGTTIEDIATACGFNPSNVYNYYPSKEYILYTLYRAFMDSLKRIGDMAKAKSSGTPTQQLIFMIKQLVKHRIRNNFGRILDSEFHNLSPIHRKEIDGIRAKALENLYGLIDEGIRAGEFAPVDAHLIAFAIIGMNSHISIWYSPKGKASPGEIGNIYANYVINGLRPK